MFSQPEVCILSDLHFGVHQNSPLWHDTALRFVKWLKSELCSRGIKDIIISGDVFHNRNDVAVNTLHVVSQIFEELQDYNIIILVGNHDAYYKDRSDVNSINILNGWKNIKVYTQPFIIEYLDKKIAICPWGTTIDQIPPADVVFGHFEIKTFKMNNFKVCDHGFTADELFQKSNLIITGHFHLREERNYKNGTVIYLGSPYELDWSDKDSSKGVYLLDFVNLKHKFIENTESPKHIEIKLTDLIRDKLAGVKDKIKGNIVRFVIDKEIEPDKIDLLIHKLNTYQPASFNTEYYCFTAVEQDLNIQQSDLGVDIPHTIDEFINSMDIKHKEKVCNYVMELYTKVNQ